MKVFRFSNDVNHYQFFFTESEDDMMKLNTECVSLIDGWQAPPVFIYKPLNKQGDLFNFSYNTLIFSPRATELLRTHLEMAGELLEIPYKGESYWLLNVLECINCIDEAKSEWVEDNGVRIYPKRYAFNPRRFSESCIFKIPETYRGEVLVLDREDGEGFVDALIENQIVGYELELLWTDNTSRAANSAPPAPAPSAAPCGRSW